MGTSVKKPINAFAILRIALGLLFIVSGGEKLISPYQNFLYVLQGYQLFPGWIEHIVARSFPWVELLTGIFLVLGLWGEIALNSAGAMLGVFITVVGQAILRKLPLDHCGCFGNLISLPLKTVFLMDTCLFFLVLVLAVNIVKTMSFSLDDYFARQ